MIFATVLMPRAPIIGAVLLAACATSAQDTDRVLDRFQERGFSGAVLIARGDNVVAKRAFGLEDGERGVANTLDTRFEIMSLTKLFVALSLVILEDDGELRLADTLETHLGTLPEDKREITIHQLLLHTAGLPSGGRELDKTSSSAFVASLMSTPLESEPGGDVHYSNPGYALGAILVERVSGTPFRDFLRERVFRPAQHEGHCIYRRDGGGRGVRGC